MLGCFAFAVLWVTIPVEPVRINVRWAPAVTERERAALEREFHLAEGRPQDDTTWGYVLFDYSTENIRAVVTHPQVVDTHFVDREAFRPIDPPPSWTTRAVASALLFGVGGALVLVGLAGTVDVRRFWRWVAATALVLVALPRLTIPAVERLLATAPWLAASSMLVVGAVASIDRRVELTPRVLTAVLSAAPLILAAIGALMLLAAAAGCRPPWAW